MIYMGCKGGIIEVWCKKKLSRKEILKVGTNSKVICMDLDSSEDYLVVGTSDGKVQVINILQMCQYLFNSVWANLGCFYPSVIKLVILF